MLNKYNEVQNNIDTYIYIAKRISKGDTIGIGWADEETHFDIVFKLGLDEKVGDFQRGIKKHYLYVSIIDHTSYGFIPDTVKEKSYIKQKLRMDNKTGDNVADLINGVIIELNKIEEK